MAKYQHITLKDFFVEAEQYTNPSSVDRIMDMIGTKGVINSLDKLYIFRDYTVIVEKNWYVIKLSDYNIDSMPNKLFDLIYKKY